MVSIEEIAYLPREPKPIKIRGEDYYEIAELALIKIGFFNPFIPVLSIGLQMVGNSYHLLFSQEAKQTREQFIPFALDTESKKIGNILVYLSAEKLKHRG